MGSDALDEAVGPQQHTDDIWFSKHYLTDLDPSNFNAGPVPFSVRVDTASNAKLPTSGGLGTVTAAVRVGTGWGNPKALSCWVMTRASTLQTAPLSNSATPWEGKYKEKGRVFKNTPLTAHILQQPLRSPTCLVI